MKKKIAAVSLAGLLLLSGVALMGCGAGAGTASDSAVYETTAASPAAAMAPQFAAETAEETGIMKAPEIRLPPQAPSRGRFPPACPPPSPTRAGS